MSDHVEPDLASFAVEHTLGLMRPLTENQYKLEAGYIDVLGSRDPIGPSFLQRAMAGKIVPRIYERIWRPIASRAFYGLLGPTPANERRIVLDMLGISPGDLVLDIGCGPGHFTRQFAGVVGSGLVVGLDASGAMLTAAVKRDVKAKVAYVRGDACELPFQDATFDAVGCFAALHLVENPMKALDEMNRVLAPGGRLGVITTWGRKNPPPRMMNGLRIFDRDEVTNALLSRGLVDVEQRLIGWGQIVSTCKPAG